MVTPATRRSAETCRHGDLPERAAAAVCTFGCLSGRELGRAAFVPGETLRAVMARASLGAVDYGHAAAVGGTVYAEDAWSLVTLREACHVTLRQRCAPRPLRRCGRREHYLEILDWATRGIDRRLAASPGRDVREAPW
jgi:hypothetical protein